MVQLSSKKGRRIYRNAPYTHSHQQRITLLQPKRIGAATGHQNLIGSGVIAIDSQYGKSILTRYQTGGRYAPSHPHKVSVFGFYKSH
ncbi:hypothetical protein WP8S18C01_P30050 (plasmid) [Aeromonas caviae]|nr:hypothetical protein ACGSH8M1_p30110 [Aeromonas caviae]BBT55388.1 hypothetical protein WP8S18C01_P30050 [Aeromonas caviae]